MIDDLDALIVCGFVEILEFDGLLRALLDRWIDSIKKCSQQRGYQTVQH